MVKNHIRVGTIQLAPNPTKVLSSKLRSKTASTFKWMLYTFVPNFKILNNISGYFPGNVNDFHDIYDILSSKFY